MPARMPRLRIIIQATTIHKIRMLHPMFYTADTINEPSVYPLKNFSNVIKIQPGVGVDTGVADQYRIRLLGLFSFVDNDGKELAPKGRKAVALLALLSTAPDGRRGRKWLQDRLWSDRSESQGSASLRQTLYEIRTRLGSHKDILHADANIISIDLSRVTIDTQELSDVGELPLSYRGEIPQFLEGLDVADEEFESWLREQRNYWNSFFESARVYSGNSQEAGEQPAAIPLKKNHEFFKSQDLISPLLEDLAQESGAGAHRHQFLLSNSTAILPLINKTGLDEYEYISDGISQDLLEGLAKLRWLPVISYSSTSVFRESNRDIVAIADQLSARYVVEGELGVQGSGIKVRIRLTNAASGLSLWSREFEIERAGFQSRIKEMLSEIVGIIDNKIDIAEQNRVISTDQSFDAFHDHIWRGRWFLSKLTMQDSDKAKEHFDAAYAIRPEEPEILLQLAYWHLYRSWVLRASPDEIDKGATLARQAMALDPSDSRSYFLIGMSEAWRSNHGHAEELLRKSIELNPSLSMAHLQLGSTLYLSGEPLAAISPIETAIRLSPNDRLIFDFFGELAMAHLMAGNHHVAIRHATHAIWLKPRYWYGHVIRICAQNKLGDRESVENAARGLASTGRALSWEHFQWLPFKDRSWVKELYETTQSALSAIR
ncbi:hypothetical protein [Hoeflea sp. TYP-13]|uniref:hypothetical protein n=1 Tax=Hoeflea sp. TYP-13 TaxID=3230023 RepID=UPI0034C6D03B